MRRLALGRSSPQNFTIVLRPNTHASGIAALGEPDTVDPPPGIGMCPPGWTMYCRLGCSIHWSNPDAFRPRPAAPSDYTWKLAHGKAPVTSHPSLCSLRNHVSYWLASSRRMFLSTLPEAVRGKASTIRNSFGTL